MTEAESNNYKAQLNKINKKYEELVAKLDKHAAEVEAKRQARIKRRAQR